MKVLLVDDHISFCEGLIAAVTARRPDFEFYFESDAELVPTSLLGKASFDLIIIDIMMPGIGGIELVRQLNEIQNFIPIVVLSSNDDVMTIQQIFSLGVLAFIPKYYSVEEIIDVMDRSLQGEMHIPAKLQEFINIDTNFGGQGNEDSPSQKALPGLKNSADNQIKLTKRQIEILSLMDQGLSNQEMADVLHIGLATVKTHIHHLYLAFNVNSRINCLRAAKKARLG